MSTNKDFKIKNGLATSGNITINSTGEVLKLVTSGDTSSSGTNYLRFYDSTGSKGYLGYGGTANALTLASGTSNVLDLQGTVSINSSIGGVVRTSVTATGLSVTGTLSNTGLATIGGSGNDNFYINGKNGSDAYLVLNTGTTVTGKLYFGSGPANVPVAVRVNNATVAEFSSTGLSVTGVVQPSTDLVLSSGQLTSNSGSNPLLFGINNAVKATLDTTGNLGLGITPSAWSGFKVLQVNKGGFASFLSGANIQTGVFSNLYFDGTSYKYIDTAVATYYNQNNGTHQWWTAPSGTAGTAATLTQRAAIDAGGLSVTGNITTTAAANIGSSSSFCNFTAAGQAIMSAGAGSSISFRPNASATDSIVIDAAGNLGIGNAANTGWGTYQALQIKNGSMAGYAPSNDLRITSGAYYNVGWKYMGANKASQILLDGNNGTINFYVDNTTGVTGGSTANSANAAGNQVLALTSAGATIAGETSTSGSMRAYDFKITADTNGVNYGYTSASKFLSIGYGLAGSADANFGSVKIYDGKAGVIATFSTTGLTTASTLSVIGGGIQLDNGHAIGMKNSTGTIRSAVVTGSDNYLELGKTVDGGARIYYGTGNVGATLDTTGNFGLGITPSTSWGTGWKANQISGISVANSGVGTYSSGVVASNAVMTGTSAASTAANYVFTDYASMYRQTQGQHQWYTAPSSTAGGPITFTPVLTLDATGALASASGTSGNIANGATVDLFNLPSVGMYMVYARQANAGNGGIRAMAFAVQGSSTNTVSSIVAVNGATLSSPATGFNVQVTNTAGGPLYVSWSYIKIG
jgi:hypothetical protein